MEREGVWVSEWNIINSENRAVSYVCTFCTNPSLLWGVLMNLFHVF